MRPAPGLQEVGEPQISQDFAFLHHESGVSDRTLMNWLGDSDLETTLGYLQIADIRSARIRLQVNKTFEALARRTKLMTVRELAELLGCHQMAIYGWTKAGVLPHIRVEHG